MIKQKLPIVSLILYILAGLFLIYAVWAAVFSFRYISSMVSMGQVVVRDSLFEVISFHVANFGQYVVFAALLFGAGWIVHLISVPFEEELFDTDLEIEALETAWEDVAEDVQETVEEKLDVEIDEE